MKRFAIALTLVCMIGVTGAVVAQTYKQSDTDTAPAPLEGYVPNAKVAEQIAYAILVPVYGRALIDSQRPFKTILIGRNTKWRVEGTLPEFVPRGGTFVVEISKRDARVLRMVHYQ